MGSSTTPSRFVLPVCTLLALALLAPWPATRAEEEGGKAARPAASTIPALPDAGKVWQAVDDAIAPLKMPNAVFPRLRKLDVSLRRVSLLFVFQDRNMPDKLRAALQESPLRARKRPDKRIIDAGEIREHGRSGLLQTSFTLNFREDGPMAEASAVRARKHPGVSIGAINQAAAAAAVTVTAHREKVDPSSRGYRTVSRKLLVAPSSLRSLRAFVHNLSKSDLTPFEVIWSLLDDKANSEPPFDKIGKATVVVGYRERHNRPRSARRGTGRKTHSPLLDARAVMWSAIAAVNSLRRDASYLPRIENLAVADGRVLMAVRLPDGDTKELESQLRRELMLAPGLDKPDLAAVEETGGHRVLAVSMEASTHVRYDLRLPRASAVRGISLTTLNQAADAASMRMVFSSAERRDAHAQDALVTVSRKLTYAPTRLPNLQTLLYNVNARGLYHVMAVSWSLQDDKDNSEPPFDKIGKPSVTIGYREALGR